MAEGSDGWDLLAVIAPTDASIRRGKPPAKGPQARVWPLWV